MGPGSNAGGCVCLFPRIVCKYLQEDLADRYDVIHLHSSSLHLLDRIVDVAPQKCIEMTSTRGGGVSGCSRFSKWCSHGKKLIVRKLDLGDWELLRKEISPRGLLQIVIDEPEEAKRLRDFFRPWL